MRASAVESEFKHCYVETEPGVWLHYVELGAGPLVVLLHGFPEFFEQPERVNEWLTRFFKGG
jgi:pimeloyl-ACP methyl ester carboxylesterase